MRDGCGKYFCGAEVPGGKRNDLTFFRISFELYLLKVGTKDVRIAGVDEFPGVVDTEYGVISAKLGSKKL